MGVGKVTQTEIKPHNKRYSKVNVPTKVTIITPPVSNTATVTSATETVEVSAAAPVTTPTIDANKRKQLPAWIREGLEKMEKDKQKQLEKEREKHAREEFKEKVKQEEKEKMEILKREVMQRSKFVGIVKSVWLLKGIIEVCFSRIAITSDRRTRKLPRGKLHLHQYC